MNNNTIKQIALVCSCFILGILFFLWRTEYIVFRSPFTSRAHLQQPLRIIKKKVTLFHWHNDAWHTETEELIWSEKKGTNIQTIINSLLRLLEQEQILRKRITVESVACTLSEQECYLSFDGNPLDKEWSTLQAWMFIESILRTIRDNDITIDSMYFLIRHQLLQDPRLDFSTGWPSSGFIQSESRS